MSIKKLTSFCCLLLILHMTAEEVSACRKVIEKNGVPILLVNIDTPCYAIPVKVSPDDDVTLKDVDPELIIPKAVLEAEKSLFMIAKLIFDIDKKTFTPIFLGQGVPINDNGTYVTAKFHIFNESNRKVVDDMPLIVYRSWRHSFYSASAIDFIDVDDKDDNDPIVIIAATDKMHEADAATSGPPRFMATPLKFRETPVEPDEDVYSIEVEAMGSYRIITARKVIAEISESKLDPLLNVLKRNRIILTDGLSNPGSSGSILLDKDGLIVGIQFSHDTGGNRTTCFQPVVDLAKKLREKHVIK